MESALLLLLLLIVGYYGHALKWLLGQHYLLMQEALTVLKAQREKIDALEARKNGHER